MGTSQELYRKGKKLIPGGTQLLSKRPEMFLPEYWPAYYEKAKGCEVWDLDGNKYVDMCFMGIGSCIVGYADDEIDDRVRSAIGKGTISTLNAPEEVELAELLIKLHPWAEMVRYARTGGEAMAIAVRIARASKQKETVLFCGYHGWHDWYLAANLADERSLDGHHLPGLLPRGVPRGLAKTVFPFAYNDIQAFLDLVRVHDNGIAAIVIESIRNFQPDPEFVSQLNRIANEREIPLIVDEITAGWRLNPGGAHLVTGFKPDIAVFAKGMSNGYPMAAVIGKSKTMNAAQTSFISSLYWTDRIGPVAAIATIKQILDKNIPEHLIAIGKKIKTGWQQLSKKHGLDLEISGIEPLGHFSFGGKDSLVLKTLFTQLMLDKGFLASTAFYASFAHNEGHVKEYLRAADSSFEVIAKSAVNGNSSALLKGPVCQSGFMRLA